MYSNKLLQRENEQQEPYFLSAKQLEYLFQFITQKEVVEMAEENIKSVKKKKINATTLNTIITCNLIYCKIKDYSNNPGLTKSDFENSFNMGVVGVVFDRCVNEETKGIVLKFKRFTDSIS